MSSTYDIKAEMSATVWMVEAVAGREVVEGDVIVILESMKMEIPVTTPVAGVLESIEVSPQQAIQEGDVIARVRPAGS